MNNGTEKESKIAYELFDLLDVVITSLVIVVVLFTLIFKVVTIEGSSMENTLFNNEKLVISNLFYTPEYGDIVVVSRNAYNSSDNSSKQPIIKRVIAVEGQVVDINYDENRVYVDGVALEEDYIKDDAKFHLDKNGDITFPVRVPEGHVFCLGDNRNNSMDSRFSAIGDNGMIDTRYILGHSIVRIYPFNRIGKVE